MSIITNESNKLKKVDEGVMPEKQAAEQILQKDSVTDFEQAEENLEEDCEKDDEDENEDDEHENAIQNAKNLLREEDSPEKTARCTGLPLEEVQKLTEEIGKEA